MSSPSKAKGNRAENKIVKMLIDAGCADAKRSWGSNGRSLGMHEEVDVLANGCRVQVKARKSLPAIIVGALTEHVDVAVLVQDRTQPVVVMRFDDFATIVNNGFWRKRD